MWYCSDLQSQTRYCDLFYVRWPCEIHWRQCKQFGDFTSAGSPEIQNRESGNALFYKIAHAGARDIFEFVYAIYHDKWRRTPESVRVLWCIY